VVPVAPGRIPRGSGARPAGRQRARYDPPVPRRGLGPEGASAPRSRHHPAIDL
jgi:hypothetical protein